MIREGDWKCLEMSSLSGLKEISLFHLRDVFKTTFEFVLKEALNMTWERPISLYNGLKKPFKYNLKDYPKTH